MEVKGLLIDVISEPGNIRHIDLEDKDLLNQLYRVLKCNIIDAVTRKVGDRTFTIICDDEGLLKDRPIPSALSPQGQVMLVGNLFVCNTYKGKMTSLSDGDIEYLGNKIGAVCIATREGDKAFPVLIDVSS